MKYYKVTLKLVVIEDGWVPVPNASIQKYGDRVREIMKSILFGVTHYDLEISLKTKTVTLVMPEDGFEYGEKDLSIEENWHEFISSGPDSWMEGDIGLGDNGRELTIKFVKAEEMPTITV